MGTKLDRHRHVQAAGFKGPLLATAMIALWLAGSARSAAQPANSPKLPPPTAEIVEGKLGQQADAILAEATKSGGSGVVLLAKGGKIVLQKGYGLANRDTRTPVRPDMAFCIGSNTKTFTAAAILVLEQMGKLRVEDPLSRFFDGLAEEKKKITLHQLLTHSAGLHEYHDRPGEGGDFAEMSRDEAVRRILGQELSFAPGTKSSYSNCGYTLLAVVIEKASGQSWEQFLREQLFSPAGMTSTGFYGEQIWGPERMPTGYGQRRRGDNTPRSWPGVTWALKGAGGVVSTVHDQFLWHQAMRGDVLLNKAAKDKAFKVQMPGPDGRGGEGYGWMVAPTPRKTIALNHAGGNDFGFNALTMIYPQEDVFFTVMTNEQMKNQRAILTRVMKAVFAAE